MILTAWEHLKDYDSFIGNKVSGFMEKNDIYKIAAGRYELGDECYVNVDEYVTRSNYNFEAHRDYVDVQVMVDGEETVFVSSLENGVETAPYSKEKDAAFYSCKNSEYEIVNLISGKAIVLFPQDMHAPCNSSEKKRNRKFVFKIPVKRVNTVNNWRKV